MKNKTLVLGLGNTLLGDEGAGVYAIRALQDRHAGLADVEFLDGGTLSFTLAGPIEEAGNLIVIDAAQLQDRPGAGSDRPPSPGRGDSAGAETPAEPNKLVCGECGDWHTQLVSGDEMLLDSVELVKSEE